MRQSPKENRPRLVNLPPPNSTFSAEYSVGDPEFGGSILGKPGGYSSATGRARPDMTGVGEQMLRNQHTSSRARASIRQGDED